MSDDLISRKALIKDMRGRKYIDKALCEIFETVVNEAPTSFDKEKVIREIKKKYGQSAHWEVINGICEIIEKGGIE